MRSWKEDAFHSSVVIASMLLSGVARKHVLKSLRHIEEKPERRVKQSCEPAEED